MKTQETTYPNKIKMASGGGERKRQRRRRSRKANFLAMLGWVIISCTNETTRKIASRNNEKPASKNGFQNIKKLKRSSRKTNTPAQPQSEDGAMTEESTS